MKAHLLRQLNADVEYFTRSTGALTEDDSAFAPVDGVFTAAQQVAHAAQTIEWLCLLFIHPPAHGSEVSLAARNTMDSARIPRASKLLICGLFQKG